LLNTAPSDAHVFEVERPIVRRLTFDGGVFPVWLDDSTILLGRPLPGAGASIFRLNVDDTAPPAEFTSSSYARETLQASIAAGTLLLFNPTKLLAVRLAERDAEPSVLVSSTATLGNPALSPDGSRLAYMSFETGQPEVYVVSLPDGRGKVRVSAAGGHSPAWSPDGRQLYYLRGGTGFSDAPSAELLVLDAEPSFGEPQVLFPGPVAVSRPLRSYDVAPNGRLLVTQVSEQAEPPATRIELVLNWGTELARRFEAQKR
jgi:hypothetical protein